MCNWGAFAAIARNLFAPADAASGFGGGVAACLAWACAALLVLATGAAPAAAAEKLRLRITLQLPVSSHIGKNIAEFKEAVEAHTNKEVTFEIIDKGRLYPEGELIKAVASGAVEMAAIGFNQFSEKVPSVDVVQQPFLLNFDRLVQAALSPTNDIRHVIDVSIQAAAGVRPLWWQGYGSTVFFSRGRDVRDPSRIKGQRVRVLGGETMAEMIRSCGGTPVVLPADKMTQAMKDGQVDMIMVGVSSIESRGLWQVSDTITRTEHAALEFVVVINESVWQKLSPAQQQVFTEAARSVESQLRKQMTQVEADAYAFARSKGMTVHTLTPDETAAWRECSTPVLEAYMSNEQESVRNVLAAYGKLRTDPCCSAGPEGIFTRR
jgi:C4-dicarboxylate-binding protein DctP